MYEYGYIFLIQKLYGFIFKIYNCGNGEEISSYYSVNHDYRLIYILIICYHSYLI